MYTGTLVFSQIMDYLPLHTFRRYVARYQGEQYVKQFRCLDHYLVMAFAQLTYRESLRDIAVCLRAHQSKLYHMGIRSSGVARSIIPGQRTARLAYLRRLCASLDPDRPASVCRRRFRTRTRQHGLCPRCVDHRPVSLGVSLGAVSFDQVCGEVAYLAGSSWQYPDLSHLSDGKLHDVNILDILLPEPGAFYIMDRGYVDFERLFALSQAGAFFVIRAKSNTQYRRQYSHAIDNSHGLRCDQTIILTGANTRDAYPQPLRRVKYHDHQTGKTFNFLTNNVAIPAQTVADLYRYRWQVELFFKWIKQHLRIKSFFGVSENAVKTQIWVAISVYVLVAIIRKRLAIKADLYTILQVLSLTLFEKIPLNQLLTGDMRTAEDCSTPNQLNLFDNLTGQ